MEEIRLRRRQYSRIRLPEAVPTSYRRLFQASPKACNYPRSLSVLFANLNTWRRTKNNDSVLRPIRAVKLTKAESRPVPKLQIIPRPVTPLQVRKRTELLCRQGTEQKRSRSECSKGTAEVSFITLDLEPGSYHPRPSKIKQFPKFPLVYIAQLPPFLSPSIPLAKSPSPPPPVTPSPKRLKHIPESRPFPSPTRFQQLPDASSLGPWLEDYS